MPSNHKKPIRPKRRRSAARPAGDLPGRALQAPPVEPVESAPPAKRKRRASKPDPDVEPLTKQWELRFPASKKTMLPPMPRQEGESQAQHFWRVTKALHQVTRAPSDPTQAMKRMMRTRPRKIEARRSFVPRVREMPSHPLFTADEVMQVSLEVAAERQLELGPHAAAWADHAADLSRTFRQLAIQEEETKLADRAAFYEIVAEQCSTLRLALEMPPRQLTALFKSDAAIHMPLQADLAGWENDEGVTRSIMEMLEMVKQVEERARTLAQAVRRSVLLDGDPAQVDAWLKKNAERLEAGLRPLKKMGRPTDNLHWLVDRIALPFQAIFGFAPRQKGERYNPTGVGRGVAQTWLKRLAAIARSKADDPDYARNLTLDDQKLEHALRPRKKAAPEG